MRQIVAAVDFSEVTDEVLRRASELARAFSAELLLLHVAPPEPEFVGYSIGPPSVREEVAHELRDLHRRLQERAESLRAAGLDARALVLQGPIVEKLVEESAAAGADLILMGSHGRGRLHRALVGSVSEGVLRRAPCAVLIVPDGAARTPAAP